jgi:hypothetical protein
MAKHRKRDDDPIADYIEWTNNRYNPGRARAEIDMASERPPVRLEGRTGRCSDGGEFVAADVDGLPLVYV